MNDIIQKAVDSILDYKPLCALKILEECDTANHELHEYKIAKGRALAASFRYEEAEKILRNAFAQRQDSPDSHYALGELFLKRGNVSWAYDAMVSVLKIKPDHQDSLILLPKIIHALQLLANNLADLKLLFIKIIDTDKFKEIHKAHIELSVYKKYLNLDYFIMLHLQFYFSTGLFYQRNRSVYDIGTGPGYFPYICRFFGHDTGSMDMLGVVLNDNIIAHLGLDRTEHMIMAYEPLPKPKSKYDFITARDTCFNHHKPSRDPWSLDEWKFLLNDIAVNYATDTASDRFFFNRLYPNREFFFQPELITYFKD